jgi:DNA-binding transcriptional MerR regulator
MAKQANYGKVISALIETNTINQAAKECGVSASTIRRYLKEPDFRAELREANRAMYEASTARIINAADRAVTTLTRNMDCENPAVETRAAQVVLDAAGKRIEISDILERLEVLEDELNKPIKEDRRKFRRE